METSHPRLVLLGLLTLCPPAAPFGDGAPSKSCGSMNPRHHGTSPQTGPAPYTIVVNDTGTTHVEVTIMGSFYRGILLQAREPNEDVAIDFDIGAFASSVGEEHEVVGRIRGLINRLTGHDVTFIFIPADFGCFSRIGSAITHSNTIVKNNATTYIWNPPTSENCKTKMVFVATVSQSRTIYWMQIRSQEISRTCSGSVKCMSGFAVQATILVLSLTAF